MALKLIRPSVPIAVWLRRSSAKDFTWPSNIIQRRYVSNKGYTNYICVYVYIYIIIITITIITIIIITIIIITIIIITIIIVVIVVVVCCLLLLLFLLFLLLLYDWPTDLRGQYVQTKPHHRWSLWQSDGRASVLSGPSSLRNNGCRASKAAARSSFVPGSKGIMSSGWPFTICYPLVN
jgi:energy-coupling factor transporter transmembrane protein EcfT